MIRKTRTCTCGASTTLYGSIATSHREFVCPKCNRTYDIDGTYRGVTSVRSRYAVRITA